MSISISGTLTVKTVEGQRGPFNVGKLNTSIGIFEVKNPVLKKFAPGDYPGNFIIEKIKVKFFEWNGGGSAYLDVTLDWAALELMAEDGNTIETEPPVVMAGTGDSRPIEIPLFAETADDVAAMVDKGCNEIRLGEYLLNDREAMNQARSFMKEAGYCYKPQSQSWRLQVQ
ncbi:hypothetical protein PL75_10055 [Neisseria arctica]|uniref:Uncharacterized protein n=1 Tax=Neisseria arctica TaxID=1470200 RepID=A0A0J0YPM9_9NEIS|nr:DUF3275 family protein [Neisseria arctica]KLT72079.1 hypothetical protein PL75_10055 [Neisseria arctica]UOO85677.1 DUF3275 family protein [Neisseria arctica]